MISSSTKPAEIRKFGAAALLFFGVLFVYAVYREKVILSCFFGLLTTLGLGFVLIPLQLKPAYEIWIKIGHAIGKLIIMLLLTMAYFMVITPAAIIKRLVSGKPLPVDTGNKGDSFWIDRNNPAQPKSQFYKRY